MKPSIYNFNNNKIAQKAYNDILNNNKSQFITGKAGTGKSTLLKYILENTNKKYAVLAPTGIAANNVEGETIHSFFRIPLDLLDTNFKGYNEIRYTRDKEMFIKELELLIIDEVSMVHSYVLDCVNKLLQKSRCCKEPFGGVQLLTVGDPFQLAPVVVGNERALIKKHWNSEHFFDAKSFNSLKENSSELKICYRQKDSSFMEILDSIRLNSISTEMLNNLNNTCVKKISDIDTSAIIITTINNRAKQINDNRLALLEGTEYNYNSLESGKIKLKNYPVETNLRLKKGARVMFVKNNREAGYNNGTLGIVEYLDDKKIIVLTDDKRLIDVNKAEWIEYEYKSSSNEKFKKEAVGLFVQYPLKLAWAITANKSQGLTFDKVHIDFDYGAFLHGQTYVALSRCTNIDGLSFSSSLHHNDLIIDKKVVDFYSKYLC